MRTRLMNIWFSGRSTFQIMVLKASVVECQLTRLIDTQSALNQELVNSPEPRVDWLICIAWKVLDSQLTTNQDVDQVLIECPLMCQWSLDWVLIEGWLHVLIDGIDPGVDQHFTTLPFHVVHKVQFSSVQTLTLIQHHWIFLIC